MCRSPSVKAQVTAGQVRSTLLTEYGDNQAQRFEGGPGCWTPAALRCARRARRRPCRRPSGTSPPSRVPGSHTQLTEQPRRPRRPPRPRPSPHAATRRPRPGDQGDVAVHDDRVLDEDGVEAVVGQIPPASPSRARAGAGAASLLDRETVVDLLPLDMGHQSFRQSRAGAADEAFLLGTGVSVSALAVRHPWRGADSPSCGGDACGQNPVSPSAMATRRMLRRAGAAGRGQLARGAAKITRPPSAVGPRSITQSGCATVQVVLDDHDQVAGADQAVQQASSPSTSDVC